MDADDAEEYTQALGQVVAGGYRQVALGKKLGVPEALGLTTEQWVEDRLGGYVRLSLPERREAVAELGSEDMSGRQIAEVLGVDERTVRRDRTAANAAAIADEIAQAGASENDDAAGAAEHIRSLAEQQAHLRRADAKHKLSRVLSAIANLGPCFDDAVDAAIHAEPSQEYDKRLAEGAALLSKMRKAIKPQPLRRVQ